MAMNQLLVENYKVVGLNEAKNYTGAAAGTVWLSLKNYNHITYVIKTGAWAAGTAAVTLLQATAVAGTGSKALAFGFPFVWISTVATADTQTKTAVVSNTFNLDTANTVYVVEVDAASLDVTNNFDCIRLAIASPGANADFYDTTAFLGSARYKQAALPSAIID